MLTQHDSFRARPRIYALCARIMRAHTFKRAHQTARAGVYPGGLGPSGDVLGGHLGCIPLWYSGGSGEGACTPPQGQGVVRTPSCTVHRGVINRSTRSTPSHCPDTSPTARSNTTVGYCVPGAQYQYNAAFLLLLLQCHLTPAPRYHVTGSPCTMSHDTPIHAVHRS